TRAVSTKGAKRKERRSDSTGDQNSPGSAGQGLVLFCEVIKELRNPGQRGQELQVFFRKRAIPSWQSSVMRAITFTSTPVCNASPNDIPSIWYSRVFVSATADLLVFSKQL